MENKKIYILIALTVLLIISLLFVNKIFKSKTQTPYKLNEDKIESQENNLQNNFEQKDLFEPTKQEEEKVLENNEQKNVKIEKKSNNIKKTVNHNSQTIEQKKDNKIFDKSEVLIDLGSMITTVLCKIRHARNVTRNSYLFSDKIAILLSDISISFAFITLDNEKISNS